MSSLTCQGGGLADHTYQATLFADGGVRFSYQTMDPNMANGALTQLYVGS